MLRDHKPHHRRHTASGRQAQNEAFPFIAVLFSERGNDSWWRGITPGEISSSPPQGFPPFQIPGIPLSFTKKNKSWKHVLQSLIIILRASQFFDGPLLNRKTNCVSLFNLQIHHGRPERCSTSAQDLAGPGLSPLGVYASPGLVVVVGQDRSSPAAAVGADEPDG